MRFDRIVVSDGFSHDECLSARRWNERGEHLDRSSLPSTVWIKKSVDGTGWDSEVEIADCGGIPVLFGEGVGLDSRFRVMISPSTSPMFYKCIFKIA